MTALAELRLRAGRPGGRQHRAAAPSTCAPACSTRCWSARWARWPSCWRWTSRRAGSGGWRSASSCSVAGRRHAPTSTGRRPGWRCWSVTPLAGAVFFGGRLRGHRHGGVLVDRVRRDRATRSPTAGATSPRTRSRSTAAVPPAVRVRARVRLRRLLPGAGAARPGRPARRCRPGSAMPSPAVAVVAAASPPGSSGGPASATTGARARDASSRRAGCARSSPSA